MHTATLTFQICIPKAFREDMGLKAGQQFVFVARGDAIVMIPRRDISEVRGLLRGADTGNVRNPMERT